MTTLWAGLLALAAVAMALVLVAAWAGLASCDEATLATGEEDRDGECR